jgi:syntaxin 1B/2/3
MQNYGGGGGGYSGASAPSRQAPVLTNDVEEVESQIERVRRNISDMKRLQSQSINETDTTRLRSITNQIDAINAENRGINKTIKNLIIDLKRRHGQQPLVSKTERDFKATIQEYQTTEADFSRKLRANMERQYRIVRPNATEDEVREYVGNPDSQQGQVFSQALMNSNRRGEAQSTLSNVRTRHAEIQNIEKTIIELSQLFQDMENLVVEQEAAVENIEIKGEEVRENVDKGQEELGGAVKKARSARTKKWWCLFLTILIILIIVAVVVVVTHPWRK